MKRNFNNLTIILLLSLICNIQTLTASYHFSDHELITRRQKQEDEETQKADAEIEMLINSEIPEPTFENPALWKVLIRQYGIQLFYTCFNIKTWLVQTYYNIKDVIYEDSTNNETIQ